MNLVIGLVKLCIIMSGVTMAFPHLGANETKESIDAWYVQAKSIIRSMPAYTPYVDETWTAKKSDSNRGFTDAAAHTDRQAEFGHILAPMTNSFKKTFYTTIGTGKTQYCGHTKMAFVVRPIFVALISISWVKS